MLLLHIFLSKLLKVVKEQQVNCSDLGVVPCPAILEQLHENWDIVLAFLGVVGSNLLHNRDAVNLFGDVDSAFTVALRSAATTH